MAGHLDKAEEQFISVLLPSECYEGPFYLVPFPVIGSY